MSESETSRPPDPASDDDAAAPAAPAGAVAFSMDNRGPDATGRAEGGHGDQANRILTPAGHVFSEADLNTLLQNTGPLESDDDIGSEREEDDTRSAFGMQEGTGPARGRAFSDSAVTCESPSIRSEQSAAKGTPSAFVQWQQRRHRATRPRSTSDERQAGSEASEPSADSSSSSSSSSSSGGGRGGGGGGINSNSGRFSGTSFSCSSFLSQHGDSWMFPRPIRRRPRSGGTCDAGGEGAGASSSDKSSSDKVSSDAFLSDPGARKRRASMLHFLCKDAPLFEETASSSSATLSLQLPLSEDEAGFLGPGDETFLLAPDGNTINPLAYEGQGALVKGGSLSAELMSARVLGLREELLRLDRRRIALEAELREERSRHETQVRDLDKRRLEQVAGLQRDNETLLGERDAFEARLRDKKDMYKDLAISDALAQELRRVPEEDQTIKEYVSLRAYELVALSKGELERTRRDLERTREQLQAANEAGDLQRREGARARRLAAAREEGLKVDLEALKERAEDMAARAREAHRTSDENRDKARRFDEVEALLRTTRLEVDAARALAKNQAEALVDLTESEKSSARAAQDATQRSAILELDKTYLQRQLAEAQAAADRIGRKSEAASERLRDLERTKDALGAELLSVRERTRSEHQEHLEAEVTRLREQSAKELAEIRLNSREVWERENEGLREARKDALQEVSRARSDLSELQRSHEALVMSVAKADAAHEAALAEVRSELRLKSFELSQLGVAHSEKCSSLRQAGLEMDMLREQVAVHRGEFAELEASASRQSSELQILLDAERDKVRAFEDLELEVDGAVMRTGREMLLVEDARENGAGANSPTSSPPPLQNHAASDVAGPSVRAFTGGGAAAVMPVAPHRRLRQAVLLAHKLLKKERELDKATSELEEMRKRAAASESRATKAEGLLETVEQPTRYMLDSIRSKDGEIDGLRAAHHGLIAKVEALERQCSTISEEKANLEVELRKAQCDVEEAIVNASARLEREAPRSRSISPRENKGELDVEHGAGGSPAKAPSPLRHAGGAMPTGLLSEKLTVHGGRRASTEGPRWHSYRQSTLLRVPF